MAFSLLAFAGFTFLLTTLSGAITAAQAVEGRSLLKRAARDRGVPLDTDADLASFGRSGRMSPGLRDYLNRQGTRLRLMREGRRRVLYLREQAWPHREFSFDRSRD